MTTLEFIPLQNKRGREIWKVDGIKLGEVGSVRWYHEWNRFVFDPISGVLLSQQHLSEISNFLIEKNNETQRTVSSVRRSIK